MKAPLLLLDVSRLLARAQRGAPTGIDRVEFAYAEQLLRLAPERLRFVAVDKLDRLRELPFAATRRFVVAVGRGWGHGSPPGGIRLAAPLIWLQASLRLGTWSKSQDSARPYYLLISHRHLHRRERVERVLAASAAHLVVFVHDLIPIEYPEYARPQHAEIHLRRIRTVAALADAVIVNSDATGQSLQPYLDQAGRAPPMLTAPLGVQPRPSGEEGEPIAGAYFIYLSTIEPRKNHLLLLHIWRRLVEQMGPGCPRLLLIGRRGWENEMILDMLDRSEAIRPFVSELAEITDARLHLLLRGCRAVLFPSFAEGFGLPLAEALAEGVPVVCSDLPALREVGGDVPDYLDPLDGLGWLQAVRDYAADPAPRRLAQLQRAAGWRPANWPEHVATALGFVDAALRGRS